MRLVLKLAVAALLAASVAGCSDSSNRRPATAPESPAPQISLDETGIYSGTLETAQGDVALMRLTLARDGSSTISLDSTDSERPNLVLQGTSDGESGAISFTGRAPDSGAEVVIDIAIEGMRASGELALQAISGSYSLSLDASSERSGSLDAIAGSYARNDQLNGLSELDIASDGAVTLDGACSAQGNIEEIDSQVNIFRLSLNSDCLQWEGLVSREDLAAEGDVLAVSGDSSGDSLAVDFYRL